MGSLAKKLRVLVVTTVSTSVVALAATAPGAAAVPAPAATPAVSGVSAGLVAPAAVTALPTAARSTSVKRSYRSTERGLTAKTKRVHRALRAKFPRIKRVLGKRPASSGEHGKGRALDVMLPNWKSASGKALGRKIASWARSRAGSLKIWYVIYNQRIWNTQRKNEGWRKMRNAGNATGNHRNHVHISVKR